MNRCKDWTIDGLKNVEGESHGLKGLDMGWANEDSSSCDNGINDFLRTDFNVHLGNRIKFIGLVGLITDPRGP